MGLPPFWANKSVTDKKSVLPIPVAALDRVCAAQKQEFLYKRDSQGKLVNRQSRPANPGHSTAINLFEKRKNKIQKSREGGTEESNFP